MATDNLAEAIASYEALRYLFPACDWYTWSGDFASPRGAGFGIDGAIDYANRKAPEGKPIIGVGTARTGEGRGVIAVVTGASCPVN